MANHMLIRIDDDLKTKLTRLARAEGKTTSGMVRELIREYIKDRDISAYIDGLWDRIGTKFIKRGIGPAQIDKAIRETRNGRR